MSASIKLGVSAAASWAWGTSLIVGMEIAQTKGLWAWFIWATSNCLTLAFFGELTRRGLLGRHVFDKPIVKWSAILIQVFCLVIQLNIINKVVLQFGASPMASYLIATAVGVIFTLLMYRRGLETSILTDNYQWAITLVSIVVIVVVGVWQGVPRVDYPASDVSDVLWSVWSAVILMSGPIGDVQHWQRAETSGKGKAYTWASLFFALYMGLVLTMSMFQFNALMNVILLIAVLGVTSSTIDSIAVALHEVANKKIGTCVALFICVFWGIFAKMGIIELWSKAGVFRVAFALMVLFVAKRTIVKDRKTELKY